MPKNNDLSIAIKNHSNWLTIQESVELINLIMSVKLTDGDIYRFALYGRIRLSLYFQSPIILRRVKTKKNKIKIRPVESSLINRLCFLEKNYFINNINLIVSTEENHILPTQNIIDTTLAGQEYIATQRLLAQSLGIPTPITGADNIIQGISVNIFDELFLLYEKVTWQERINKQIVQLPQERMMDINEDLSTQPSFKYYSKELFPIHKLPKDACFVIRHTELEKLINLLARDKSSQHISPRISTPLSRLFWLACKHNETISPLIRQPYKLLSIFEQWASADGIPDQFSGDTLKAALQRGSPP